MEHGKGEGGIRVLNFVSCDARRIAEGVRYVTERGLGAGMWLWPVSTDILGFWLVLGCGMDTLKFGLVKLGEQPL